MFSASSISGSGGPRGGNGSARRLAAIAFADIVGYSTLMAEDEARTHRRWMALLADVVRARKNIAEGWSNRPETGSSALAS